MGCLPELANNCVDMTNSSSTYLGIAAGAAIGGIITWWIYNRQKKTSDKQDITLRRVEELEEDNERILKKIEEYEKHNERLLSSILNLEKKIDSLIENKNE